MRALFLLTRRMYGKPERKDRLRGLRRGRRGRKSFPLCFPCVLCALCVIFSLLARTRRLWQIVRRAGKRQCAIATGDFSPGYGRFLCFGGAARKSRAQRKAGDCGESAG